MMILLLHKLHSIVLTVLDAYGTLRVSFYKHKKEPKQINNSNPRAPNLLTATR